MNQIPQTTFSPKGLIARTLAVRSGMRSAGEAAALRQGMVGATEVHARPYTDVYLAGEHEKAATGWRRAAAICASSTGAPQPDQGRHPLGASLRQLFNRENPGRTPGPGNAIVSQVNSLPMLDLETAASTLALLIGRCSSRGIAVDYFALGRALSRWGRGTNSRSRAVRNQIVSDFYQHTTSTQKEANA